jgi:GNAT superfamily N-acetyltransferase
VVVAGPDTESIVEPVLAHFDQTHPDLGLSQVSVRNYLESEDRTTGPTDRLQTIGEIEIVPITPDRSDEVIRFFDLDAFPDNPAWGSCYCMFYFLGGGDNPNWGHIPWQEVRKIQHSRIEAGITTGTLAYVDGRMAGWCNATARSQFPGRMTGEDDDTVCSVVCFVIAPPYRGHGLATMLLEGAIAEARRRRFGSMEAYPRREPPSAASAYVGALEMYLRAGFETTNEDPLVVGLRL